MIMSPAVSPSSRVHRGRRALIGSAANPMTSSSARAHDKPALSKKALDQQQFLQFRKAVLTGSRAPSTPQIEKGLRGVWRMLATKRISFEQRVAVATRMLVQSLERAAVASKQAALRSKATKKGGKKLSSSARRRAAKSSSRRSAHKQKNGGITRSADGSRIYVAPPSAGSSFSSGVSSAGRHGQRQQLSKKQIDFLAFYRAMLMTGRISRDPAERSRTIKYLWANTRHLKKVEPRIKLAEAYLAGAIPFPNTTSGSEATTGAGAAAAPSNSVGGASNGGNSSNGGMAAANMNYNNSNGLPGMVGGASSGVSYASGMSSPPFSVPLNRTNNNNMPK